LFLLRIFLKSFVKHQASQKKRVTINNDKNGLSACVWVLDVARAKQGFSLSKYMTPMQRMESYTQMSNDNVPKNEKHMKTSFFCQAFIHFSLFAYFAQFKLS
jgi:hypothetical protein